MRRQLMTRIAIPILSVVFCLSTYGQASAKAAPKTETKAEKSAAPTEKKATPRAAPIMPERAETPKKTRTIASQAGPTTTETNRPSAGVTSDVAGADHSSVPMIVVENIVRGMDESSRLEVKALLERANEIRKLIKDTEEWENRHPDDSQMGELQRVQLRAEGFSIERQTRKRLEKQVKGLIQAIDLLSKKQVEMEKRAARFRSLANHIAQMQRRRREFLQQQAALTMYDPLPSTPTNSNQPKMAKPRFSEKTEIYELKQPMSFKEVSALPEVYFDAGLAKKLFDANPGFADTLDEKMKVGTLLQVPRGQSQNIISFDE